MFSVQVRLSTIINVQLQKASVMASFPVVDFLEYGLKVEDTSTVSKDTIKVLGKRTVEVFKQFGFCYLKNHGVDADLILDYMQVSRTFFELPVEMKKKYSIKSDYSFGWSKLEGERLNEDRPLVGDLHEAFNYMAFSDEKWPPVDRFETLTKEVFKVGTDLTYRFLDVLSLGLDLPEDFMRNAHKLIGQKGNSCEFRTTNYPALGTDWNIKPGQVRLGEHIDFSTVSFIFQDNVGLEVLSPEGKYVEAPPIPGTILVVIGSLLQRWTSDNLIGTTHRILIPEDDVRRKSARQSIVYFVEPDDDCVIECLDGSDKYEPVTAKGFYNYQIKQIAL